MCKNIDGSTLLTPHGDETLIQLDDGLFGKLFKFNYTKREIVGVSLATRVHSPKNAFFFAQKKKEKHSANKKNL